MMRAMALEFPGDPGCTYLDRQYMLGDDLLVAPVLTASGEVQYYVPAGTWTNFLTGERVTGPGWVTETHGFLSLPLLVRPGAVIPVGAVDDRPEYDYADGVTLRLYEIPDGARVTTVIPFSGREFTTTRTGNVIRVEAVCWRRLAGVARWANRPRRGGRRRVHRVRSQHARRRRQQERPGRPRSRRSAGRPLDRP